MNGVVVGPNELNIKNFTLTRRGEFAVNTPESPRSPCCEVGTLDFWVHFLCGEGMYPQIIKKKRTPVFKGPGLSEMIDGSISLAKENVRGLIGGFRTSEKLVGKNGIRGV